MQTLEGLLLRREQLRAELVKVETDIQVAQATRRSDGIAKVMALMAEFDLTTADLVAPSSSGRLASDATSAGGRRQVMPKFRDPISGKTWSARGLKPKWLADAIARGKRLEDFAIDT